MSNAKFLLEIVRRLIALPFIVVGAALMKAGLVIAYGNCNVEGRF